MLPRLLSALSFLAWTIPVHAQSVDEAARAAIQKAQQAQSKQPAYTVSATKRTDETTSWKLVYVAPDRYHYRETSSPTLQDEIIVTGGDVWLKETRKKTWEPDAFGLGRMVREEFRSPPSIDAAGYRVTSARTLPPADVNGVTAATYEYVVERDKDTWRVTMSVTPPLNLPVKYRAEAEENGNKSVYTWEIAHDASLQVESPAAQVTCTTGEQCLEFGMRVRKQKNLQRAAEFYDQACKAGAWQGCLGYASHLVGLMNAEEASAADKVRLAKEAASLLDGVLKAHPTVWRAYFYKGTALMRKAATKQDVTEGMALLTRARAIAQKATDADSEWDAVLWPPSQQ